MMKKTVEDQAAIEPDENMTAERASIGSSDDSTFDPATRVNEADKTRNVRFAGPDDSIAGVQTWSEQSVRFFHRTGIRPGERKDDDPVTALHPAVLHPYLPTTRFRHPWPLVVGTGPSGIQARTLPDVVDSAITALESTGDSQEIQKRALYQLEKGLRDASGNGMPIELSNVFDEVSGVLLDSINGKSDRRDDYRIALARFSYVVSTDNLLLPYSMESARTLVEMATASALASKAAAFREEVDWLSGRLADLLRIEQEDSTDGVTPERLEHTVGGAFLKEFDFGSLSHLLEEAPHGPAMPADRRERLTTIQRDIDETTKILYGQTVGYTIPDVSKALAASDERQKAFLRLIRAVQIARLEVENRYRPERHDQVFRDFSSQSIEPALRDMRPPVVLHVNSSDSDYGSSTYTSLLTHDWPTRCLVTVDRVFDDDCRLARDARLGLSVLAAGDAYVGQCCLSASAQLTTLATEAASSERSSVLLVYTGLHGQSDAVSTYLSSALTGESRSFPSFSYRPDPDLDWADRFSVEGNEQPENVWPSMELPVKEDSGLTTHRISVTAADVIASDSRFNNHFLSLSAETTTADLVPLDTYLEGSAAEQEKWIPYVLLADAAGCMVRAVVTRRAVQTASEVRDRWRLIQEWDGIRSSIADRAIEGIRTELENAYRDELENVRSEFELKLNASAKTIARQVVENIAAGLLGVTPMIDPSAGVTTPSRPVPKAPAQPTPQAPSDTDSPPATVEKETEEDDEIAFELDDAYIDTPLCTSCNECTDLNRLLFSYDENKQAFIKDVSAGSYRELVLAAEKCPVRIIHPGKPTNPKEPNLEEWVERARPFR